MGDCVPCPQVSPAQQGPQTRRAEGAGRSCAAAPAWSDTALCGHFAPGDTFAPYSAAAVPSAGAGANRFVVHVTGGLETLAGEELAAIEGNTDILLLQGKVLFTSTAPLESLRCLRAAERLALLCWSVPTPPMPGEASGGTPLRPGRGGSDEPDAAFARKAEFADDFDQFYSALPPPARAWLREFEALLRTHALPALQAQEGAWRVATGHETCRAIAFRADVNRGGKRSATCGVTSLHLVAVCLEMKIQIGR
jgi:hypothetical protein